MRDFISALIGGKHCGWCNLDKETFFERMFDGYHGDQGPVGRLYWRWVGFNTSHIRIWMLGQEWHHRVHAHAKGPATWR